MKEALKKILKTNNKISFVVFVVIFALSFVAFINSIVLGNLMKIGLSLAALILYFMPFFARYVLKINLPTLLEIIYYLFIFASLILGEVFAFYGPFPWWDLVLHALSGFVLAGIGLSLVQIMSKNKSGKFFALMFAFCFSVTLGTVWECIEFSFDMTLRTDAQKDAHIHNISTITMQRNGGNQPVRLNDIVSTNINLASGETITVNEGYLDIGLMDTMKDTFVNITGALAFVAFGAFSNSVAKNFVITKRQNLKQPLK